MTLDILKEVTNLRKISELVSIDKETLSQEYANLNIVKTGTFCSAWKVNDSYIVFAFDTQATLGNMFKIKIRRKLVCIFKNLFILMAGTANYVGLFRSLLRLYLKKRKRVNYEITIGYLKNITELIIREVFFNYLEVILLVRTVSSKVYTYKINGYGIEHVNKHPVMIGSGSLAGKIAYDMFLQLKNKQILPSVKYYKNIMHKIYSLVVTTDLYCNKPFYIGTFSKQGCHIFK